MSMILYNGKCEDVMKKLGENSVDIILTSPPYNTNKKSGKNTTLANSVHSGYTHVRYDVLVDNLTNDEYCEKTVNWFIDFDRILRKDGVILWNVSYGSENTECMFLAVSEILRKTSFTIADRIVWKKHNALPNNMSPNKLTRICEDVFVFCRRDEFRSFHMNKKVASVRENGQKNYENVYNFIEARNNDGSCSLNKATYSTELCSKLLSMYGGEGCVVFDPFSGTGTTANSCADFGFDFIGCELSEAQCLYSKDRLASKNVQMDILKIPYNSVVGGNGEVTSNIENITETKPR